MTSPLSAGGRDTSCPPADDNPPANSGDLATTSRVIPHHERRMMVDTQELEKLQGIARQCRRDIVKMVHHAGSGHPAGSLSAIDILVVLYFRHMNIRTEEPQWRERDMFFLSKGHCTPAYYSVLAARGYFDHDELMTFRDLGTRLQGHPSNTHLECRLLIRFSGSRTVAGQWGSAGGEVRPAGLSLLRHARRW